MKNINLDQINLSPAELARLRPCEDTLVRYTDMIRDGVELPAVKVFHDGDRYWLADGRHRLEARRRLGYGDINADVVPGTERDAKLHAFSANLTHGLASNRSDRKNVASLMLADDEWKNLPNRKIGEVCGLSHTTIGTLRNSLESLSKIATPSSSVLPKRVKPTRHTVPQDFDNQSEPYDPTEDEHREAVHLIADLESENDRLREAIALGNLDLPESEKMDLANELKELRKNLEFAQMESRTIAISRDTYMTRCTELIQQVKRMQPVLKRKDEEINLLKEELAQAKEQIESLEGDLAFERATR